MLTLLCCLGANATTFQAEVLDVLAGDRLTILHDGQQVELRLYGIACPDPSTPLGRSARNLTARLVKGKTVHVDPISQGPDRPIVGTIQRATGNTIAALLLETGRASCSEEGKTNDHFASLESKARADGKGLWAGLKPKGHGLPPLPLGQGYIRGPCDEFYLTLAHGEVAPVYHQLRSRNNLAVMSTGKYRLERIHLELAGEDGSTWYASAYSPGNTSGVVTVDYNRVTDLNVGPPFNAKINIYQKDRTCNLGLVITGQGGERYYAFEHNRQRVAPPGFQVVDNSGTVMVRGRFKYGQDGTCSYPWHVPPSLKGPVTILPEVEVGPFEINCHGVEIR